MYVCDLIKNNIKYMKKKSKINAKYKSEKKIVREMKFVQSENSHRISNFLLLWLPSLYLILCVRKIRTHTQHIHISFDFFFIYLFASASSFNCTGILKTAHTKSSSYTNNNITTYCILLSLISLEK